MRKKKNNEVYIHYLNGIYAAITDGEFEAEAALRALACTAATLVLSKGLELGFLQEGVPTHEVVQRTADRIVKHIIAIVARETNRANDRYGERN